MSSPSLPKQQKSPLASEIRQKKKSIQSKLKKAQSAATNGDSIENEESNGKIASDTKKGTLAATASNQTYSKSYVSDPDGTFNVARNVYVDNDKKSATNKKRSITDNDDENVKNNNSSNDVAKIAAAPVYDRNSDDRRERALARRPQKLAKQVLFRHEQKHVQATVQAANAMTILQTAQAGLLEPENDMEKTFRLTQQQLKSQYLLNTQDNDNADAARQIYDLTLPQHAPYGLKYDRSGRYSLLYGRKGHIAMLNNHSMSKVTDFYLNERLHDACFLHNFTLFAVAQKDCVYIYDSKGAEVHQMDKHSNPLALEFLPYHWLLASIGKAGILRYQDTSTGQSVSEHATKAGGSCHVLRQNTSNAVIHAGHINGTVTLWSPAQNSFLVKMNCHKGAAVTALAVDDHTMVTGATDSLVHVWDLRTYQRLHTIQFKKPPMGSIHALDISQRGLLGIGHGQHVSVYNSDALRVKPTTPYMHQLMRPKCGPVHSLRFRPFADVCGIGHAQGISSMVIPGAGEPQIDSYEYNTNPYQDRKQRREEEVRALLDKLSPAMISLDPNKVGGIEPDDPHTEQERLRDLQNAANGVVVRKKKPSKKRGKSKVATQIRSKEAGVTDKNRNKLRQAKEEEAEKARSNDDKRRKEETDLIKEMAPTALKRFF